MLSTYAFVLVTSSVPWQAPGFQVHNGVLHACGRYCHPADCVGFKASNWLGVFEEVHMYDDICMEIFYIMTQYDDWKIIFYANKCK